LLKSYNADDRYVIALNYNIEVKRLPLSHELQLNLYRILQEQLRNILKHANATAIDVALFVHDNSLQMTIKDNGIGFNSKANYEGIGMASMMRRVQLFSGSFKVASAIGAGCEVVVNIPLSNNN
jgi:signal transduction histidine kinase